MAYVRVAASPNEVLTGPIMHDLPVSVNVIRAGVANPYAFTMYLAAFAQVRAA
ncbi:hypothetical protein ABNV53_12665 [Mycobacterium tuberculosis]|uniref:hypothetical protein n=1 Tax=Mycobacterium tuberculosis TaxID=1773 RepID=UPI000B19861A